MKPVLVCDFMRYSVGIWFQRFVTPNLKLVVVNNFVMKSKWNLCWCTISGICGEIECETRAGVWRQRFVMKLKMWNWCCFMNLDLWWHPMWNQCWYVSSRFVMTPNSPKQAGPDAQRPPTGTCMWRTPSRTAAGTTGNVADASSHPCYCWPLPSWSRIGELSTAKNNFEPSTPVEGLELGWLCQVPMLAFGRNFLEHRTDWKFGHSSTAKCCKADSEGFEDIWQEIWGSWPDAQIELMSLAYNGPSISDNMKLMVQSPVLTKQSVCITWSLFLTFIAGAPFHVVNHLPYILISHNRLTPKRSSLFISLSGISSTSVKKF